MREAAGGFRPRGPSKEDSQAKRGRPPDGSGITEFEYRRARESGLHCLIYIKDEEVVAPEFKETDALKAARLHSLVAEMRRVHKVEPFRNSSALAVRAAADLHRWLFDEYLAPILQDAVNGEFPRPEAQNMLQ